MLNNYVSNFFAFVSTEELAIDALRAGALFHIQE